MSVELLAQHTGKADQWSVEQMLSESLREVREGNGVASSAKKCVVIFLDTADEGYDIGFMQSGMSMSECVALCEIAKARFMTEMGY